MTRSNGTHKSYSTILQDTFLAKGERAADVHKACSSEGPPRQVPFAELEALGTALVPEGQARVPSEADGAETWGPGSEDKAAQAVLVAASPRFSQTRTDQNRL